LGRNVATLGKYCENVPREVRLSVRNNVFNTPIMPKIKPSRDIQPLTAFRANAAQYLEQVRTTGQPLVLTQHGRGAAVLLDVEAFESMVDELELLRDVRSAEAELRADLGSDHSDVAQRLREALPR
jgi:antitoxin YefM